MVEIKKAPASIWEYKVDINAVDALFNSCVSCLLISAEEILIPPDL